MSNNWQGKSWSSEHRLLLFYITPAHSSYLAVIDEETGRVELIERAESVESLKKRKIERSIFLFIYPNTQDPQHVLTCEDRLKFWRICSFIWPKVCWIWLTVCNGRRGNKTVGVKYVLLYQAAALYFLLTSGWCPAKVKMRATPLFLYAKGLDRPKKPPTTKTEKQT